MPIYWTNTEELAVAEYNAATSSILANEIYEKKLHAPLSKLVECVANTFKWDYIKFESMDLQRDVLGFLVSYVLPKIDTTKGKAFSFLSVSAKNYLIVANDRQHKHDKKHNAIIVNEQSENDNEVVLQSPDTYNEETERKEFYKLMQQWWAVNLDKVFAYNQRNRISEMRIVARAIVECFTDVPEFANGDKKKQVYVNRSLHRKVNGIVGYNVKNRLFCIVKRLVGAYTQVLYQQYMDTGMVEMELWKVEMQKKTTMRKICFEDGVKKDTATEILTTKKELTENEKIEVKCRYNNDPGCISDLCNEFGIGPAAVVNIGSKKTVKQHRMDEQKAIDVRERYAKGNITVKELALEYKVSVWNIYRILKGVTFKKSLSSDYVVPPFVSCVRSSGEQHHNAKLTNQQVLDIVKQNDGKRGTQARLAKQYAVNQHVINDILLGRKWSKVTGIQCETKKQIV